MTDHGPVRLRSIALPTEHGGWGFTLEPILLGLLVAPTWAGLGLAIATAAVFLARRPVKLVSTDLVRKRHLPRTRIASWFAFGYGAVGLAGLALAILTATGPFWWPLVAAIPPALVSLRADAQSRNRGLIPELAGGVAMGSAAAAIVLAADWDWAAAFGLWLVLAARSYAAIIFARGQVRRAKNQPYDRGGVHAAQVGAVLVVALAASLGIVPLLSALAVLVLGLGSFYSLARPPVPAKTVGWTQMVYGLVVVFLTAIGVWTGW
jgi:4-hydroxybenzoate polyprenyltransferase